MNKEYYIINQDGDIVLLLSVLFVAGLPQTAFANPIVGGVSGRAETDFYLFIPNIIIEFLVIAFLLKSKIKTRLFGGVFRIHLLTFPLTMFAGAFFLYFAEVIPLLIEPLYYINLLTKYRNRGILDQLPSHRQVWKAVILANLVTFSLGICLTAYLEDSGYFRTHSGKYRPNAAKAVIEMLSDGLNEFKKDTGRYPTTEEGLNALIINPGLAGWQGPYLKNAHHLKDPWGQPYHYRSPGIHGDFDLWSYGIDNMPDGQAEAKDITNWDK